VSGDPAGEILSAAESSGVDAITVGSRGMGELKALLLGSVSNKVTHLAHCTVMIVR
jgi:nucleotide-binding universal stress UspA family protein